MIIGYARNPEPDDPVDHPLDDVDWDLPYVNLCDYEIYKEYLGKYEDPIRYFEKDSTRFYIHPDFPKIIKHNNRWIEDTPLDDYDDDVSWEEIMEDIKDSAYWDLNRYEESMRETRGGSLNL